MGGGGHFTLIMVQVATQIYSHPFKRNPSSVEKAGQSLANYHRGISYRSLAMISTREMTAEEFLTARGLSHSTSILPAQLFQRSMLMKLQGAGLIFELPFPDSRPHQ